MEWMGYTFFYIQCLKGKMAGVSSNDVLSGNTGFFYLITTAKIRTSIICVESYAITHFLFLRVVYKIEYRNICQSDELNMIAFDQESIFPKK